MNDRFRFRVVDNRDWSDEKGTMYYDAEQAYDYLTDIPVNCFGGLFDDDWIVEQCTGLKDKNGNLIYESDYIKDKFGNVFLVRWFNAKFICEDQAETQPIFSPSQEWLNICEFETIGNIHEVKGGK